MVKGTAGATFTINVASASGTAISGNLLKGQTSTSSIAATNHYVFGYNKSDATEYGFYGLTAATEVAAGKAYLETTLTSSSLRIVFDSDPTAIQAVSNNSEAVTATPVKVIKDGKLYIGNYNVAGARVK